MLGVITWMHLGLVPVGLAAGLIGGLLGVGGSVLMIPAMMWLLGPDLHVYQGAAMIVNFFVIAPAAMQHIRARAVIPAVVRVAIPTAAGTILLGVWVSESPWFRGENVHRLSHVFGAFLWYVAAYNVWRLVRGTPAPGAPTSVTNMPTPKAWAVAAAVGLPAGFVGGLLGIGGGALAVPFQQVFLRVPLRNAIANSAVMIAFISVIGATYKNVMLVRQGMHPATTLVLAALLIPTAMVGGYYGARLTHRLPRRLLRAAFAILMIVAGYQLLRR